MSCSASIPHSPHPTRPARGKTAFCKIVGGLKNGCTIERIVVAYEAGRDGFWLARWLRTHGIEAHVIHSSSVAVSREHRRAKTDRLDTAMLLRVFMGWLRGERGHCGMVAVPTIDDGRRSDDR